MSDDLVKRLREGDHFERVMSAEEAADCIEALEARVSAAEKALSQACASLDGIDATGPQEFYLALSAYQATKENTNGNTKC
jgi:hypothetical protein